MVCVGADRIAANGDAANKIGTYTVAIAANIIIFHSMLQHHFQQLIQASNQVMKLLLKSDLMKKLRISMENLFAQRE